MKRLFSTLALILLNFACATTPNYVSSYFSEAELQLEAKSQCQELKRALTDLMSQNPPYLKMSRYRNYQGEESKWNAIELINRYYVPTQKPLNEDLFFKDYQKSDARRSFQKQIDGLGDCSSTAADN